MVGPVGLDMMWSFLIVAEELNFRRSAERLHINQSALTRRIQKLEESLGFRLLERTTREVSLTLAGQSLYDDNAHLLDRYADSITSARRIAEGKTGLVRVAYMAFAATELVPQTMARFGKLHPHIDIKLKYIRTPGQKLAIVNDEVDVGFMIGPCDHSELRSVGLASDQLYVVARHGHDLTRLPVIRPTDLAGVDLVLGDMSEWGEFRWRLSDRFHAEGVALRVKLEASNTLALIGLVAAGLGVTIYPKSLAAFMGPNLEVRPIEHLDFRIDTVLAWKCTNRSRPVQNFIDVARNLHVSA